MPNNGCVPSIHHITVCLYKCYVYHRGVHNIVYVCLIITLFNLYCGAYSTIIGLHYNVVYMYMSCTPCTLAYAYTMAMYTTVHGVHNIVHICFIALFIIIIIILIVVVHYYILLLLLLLLLILL